MNVVIVNKGYEPLSPVRLSVLPASHFTQATMFRLSGSGPEDRTPKWAELPAVHVKDNLLSGLNLPGVSVTVVAFR